MAVERLTEVPVGALGFRIAGRALDPQLHTHVVCANVARGLDGRWTALDGRALYEHAKTAGYLYQAALRAEVRERLGLGWGPVVRGAAELVGVPRPVLGEFSRRRQEILEAAREAGVEDLASERGKYLAVATRERKQYGVETHTWREEIRARAGEHGLDQATVGGLLSAAARRGRDAELVDVRGVGDRLAGPEGLTERANAFEARDALREYAVAAAQGAQVSELRAQGERFARRGDVLGTVAGGLTTQDLVAAERRLIAAAIGRAGEGTAVVDEAVVDRALAGVDRALSAEQAGAVGTVTRSGNGVDVIEALAGTGKTFTAGALRRVYEDAGHRVIGVAPTARAVRELAEEAGVAAWTLDRALLDLEAGDELPERTVVLLDEAGMAATRSSERLLALAEHAGAKVIAIGDSGQLPSVRAGGWMREVAERVGARRLSEVMRQRDPDERRALAELHDGGSQRYLAWAQQHDRVHAHPGPGAPDAALADWHQAVARHGPAQAVLIARDNHTRAALNSAAREHLRGQGALGADHAYGPVTVAVGDRVICRRNDRFADVDNGTRGTVLETRESGLRIRSDAGTERELPAGYVAEHVEHAYCLTGHGMQGATVEHATVVAAPRALTRGWSYTALSRARGATELHIDGNPTATPAAIERSQIAPHDDRRTLGSAQVVQRAAAQMKVRDDEDLAIRQLPTRPAPGRVDDPELARPTAAGPDRGDPSPLPQPASLRDLRAALDDVAEQRARLPLRELRELDAVDTEIVQVSAQRDQAAARLAALPSPRLRLARHGDEHAAERARLHAAVESADRQLAALRSHSERLTGVTGGLPEARAERDALERRQAQLRRDATAVRDQLAELQVANPPAWATTALGERPTGPHGAQEWDRGVRAIARHRIEHNLPDDVEVLGPEPDDSGERSSWREARATVRHVQHRLGRAVERERGLDHWLER